MARIRVQLRAESVFSFDRNRRSASAGTRIYLAVECFDSRPDQLLGNQMVRDGLLSGDDRFMWTLDPYNNQRSGYFFRDQPVGCDGRRPACPRAQGSGFATTQNRGWDGIWLARVRRIDRGWIAEIAIPFGTLRFDPGAAEWGINFQRTVRRKNEESLWSGYAHNEGAPEVEPHG